MNFFFSSKLAQSRHRMLKSIETLETTEGKYSNRFAEANISKKKLNSNGIEKRITHRKFVELRFFPWSKWKLFTMRKTTLHAVFLISNLIWTESNTLIDYYIVVFIKFGDGESFVLFWKFGWIVSRVRKITNYFKWQTKDLISISGMRVCLRVRVCEWVWVCVNVLDWCCFHFFTVVRIATVHSFCLSSDQFFFSLPCWIELFTELN